jgi:hypothetical protein
MACASTFAVVWQALKTRHLTAAEHKQNAAILKRHTKQLRTITHTLEAHLDDHKEKP